MAKLHIPASVRAGLLQLGSLPVNAFDELTRAMLGAEPVAAPAVLARRLKGDLPGFTNDALDQIVSTSIALASQVADGQDHEKYIGDIISSVFDNPEKLPDFERGTLDDRLSRILLIDAVLLSARAISLLTDQANVLIGQRVLSDLRPIFKDEVARPEAAVIYHNLKLVYLHNSQRREFFVALDTPDLQKLILALQRAQGKGAELELIAKENDLLIIPALDNDDR